MTHLLPTGRRIMNEGEALGELGAVMGTQDTYRRELEEWATANVQSWLREGQEHAKTYSAEQRRKAAKEGAAMADGSFPIYTQQDAENAASLSGMGDAAKTAVMAHIRKRVKALGLKMPQSMMA